MKKNVMMRLAAILLVCVLASTCGISGTYAKYVTQGEAKATARVAKWGVEFANTSDLFLTEYEYDDKSEHHKAEWKFSVQSDDSKYVVAPGTSGDALKLKTSGTPEVSYIVEFEVENFKTIYLLKDKSGTAVGYYPVEFTLTIGGITVPVTGRDAASVIAALNNLSYFYEVTTGKYYYRFDDDAAWTEYGTTIPEIVLSWNWVFSENNDLDKLDTILGDLAADLSFAGITAADYNLDIVIDINTVATQID